MASDFAESDATSGNRMEAYECHLVGPLRHPNRDLAKLYRYPALSHDHLRCPFGPRPTIG